MNVILLDYIDKVGDKHDVVTVKNGFGRNYLIPKGLAIVANKANMGQLKGMQKQEAKKEAAKVGMYQELADKLSKAKLIIKAKAGESGRLFGSVSKQHLIDAIKDQLNLEIEKRVVQMPDEVKELGSYEATLKFHVDVITTSNFDVVRDKSGGAKKEVPKAEVAEAAAVVEEAPAVEEVAAVVEDTPAVEEAAAVVEDAAAATEEPAAVIEDAAEEVVEAAETAVAEATEPAPEEAEPAADAETTDDTDKA